MKKIIIMTFCVCLSLFALASCGDNKKEILVGKWERINVSGNAYFEFSEDSTCKFVGESGLSNGNFKYKTSETIGDELIYIYIFTYNGGTASSTLSYNTVTKQISFAGEYYKKIKS